MNTAYIWKKGARKKNESEIHENQQKPYIFYRENGYECVCESLKKMTLIKIVNEERYEKNRLTRCINLCTSKVAHFLLCFRTSCMRCRGKCKKKVKNQVDYSLQQKKWKKKQMKAMLFNSTHGLTHTICSTCTTH